MHCYAHETLFEPYDHETKQANAYAHHPNESSSMMLVIPMAQYPQITQQPYAPQRQAQSIPTIKCYRCVRDYLVKYCLEPPLPKQRLPPIEQYCKGCCVGHFLKISQQYWILSLYLAVLLLPNI